jgi:hypothetical protein
MWARACHTPIRIKALVGRELWQKGIEKLDRARVGETVEHEGPIPPFRQKACLPQDHDLLGNVGLPITQVGFQMANAGLSMA